MLIPDRWVIIRITKPEETFYKVLAGASGGYLTGSSWKLNSGIKSYEETPEYYDFHGFSGSIYRCYKNREGFSSLMLSVYASYKKEFTPKLFKQISIKIFERDYAKFN